MVAVIYTLLGLAIGFGIGIVLNFVKRKHVTPPGGELPYLVSEVEDGLTRLVSATGNLWKKTNLPTIKRPFHQREIRTIHTEHDITERLKGISTILDSQTDKITRVVSIMPQFDERLLSAPSPSMDMAHFNSGSGDAKDVAWVSEPNEEREQYELAIHEERNDLGREGPSESLLDVYNQAVSDTFARESVRERFRPLRIGTINAVERRQNPTAIIKPDFRETTNGDFFAFSLHAPDSYAVVPRLGLTIRAVIYHAGALGEMFGGPPYDPSQSYSQYRVREPALFRKAGEEWFLVKPGKLDMGPPD